MSLYFSTTFLYHTTPFSPPKKLLSTFFSRSFCTSTTTIDEEIKQINKSISDLEIEIKNLTKTINKIDSKLETVTDQVEKQSLSDEKKSLHEQKILLLKKEQSLRDEKKSLNDQKLLLLKKEQSQLDEKKIEQSEKLSRDELTEIVKGVFKDFEFPDINQKNEEMKQYQKKVLRDLASKSHIESNPLKFTKNINGDMWHSVDIRFIPPNSKIADDPLYNKMIEYSKVKKYNLFILRAVSGGGKTGVMLNAIGRNKFLLYTQCSYPGTANTKDYYDHPFTRFWSDVITVCDSKDGKDKTLEGTLICTLFWLARVMILEHVLMLKPGLKPIEWLCWSLNGGQGYIAEVQNQFIDLFRKWNLGKDNTDLINKSTKLKDILSILLIEFDVWLGIDEAQMLEIRMNQIKFSRNIEDREIKTKNGQIRSQWRSFLFLLAIDSVHQPNRIICGTRYTDFEEFCTSGGAKGSSVWSVENDIANFPYLTPEQGLMRIKEYINLDDLNEDNKKKANVLQGRLRYVIRFVAIFYSIAHDDYFLKDRNLNVNEIFSKAITELTIDIHGYFRDRLKEINSRMIPQLYKYFLGHLKILRISSSAFPPYSDYYRKILNESFPPKINLPTPTTWPATLLHECFPSLAPEDTGFLFMDKVIGKGDKAEYVYCIREPIVLSFLEKNYQIFENLDLGNASVNEPSVVGLKYQYTLSEAMCYKLHLYLTSTFSQNDEVVNFYGDSKFTNIRWANRTSAQENISLSNAIDLLQKYSNDMKNLLKLNENNIYIILNDNDEHSKFLQEFYCNDILGLCVKKADKLKRKILEILLSIAEQSYDKRNELLLLFAQPTSMLITPSDSMGPDFIGFTTDTEDRKILVTGSCSFYNVKNTMKFQKNKKKGYLENFYRINENLLDLPSATNFTPPPIPSTLSNTSHEDCFNQFKDELTAIKKLHISVTCPYDKQDPSFHPSINMLVIYINREDLSRLDPEMAESLKKVKNIH